MSRAISAMRLEWFVRAAKKVGHQDSLGLFLAVSRTKCKNVNSHRDFWLLEVLFAWPLPLHTWRLSHLLPV